MITAFESKILAVLAITFGSLLFGFFPSILGLGSRYKNSVILSSVLCFGGGVLIATSIIHILRDVRQDIPQFAEYAFCGGFFLIYLLDVLLIILKCHSPHNSDEDDSLISSQIYSTYGSIDGTNETSHISETHISFRSFYKHVGLLAAFSVHSLLEGLVVGVQSSSSGVLLLLGAVSCHKLLVAFCLGAELSADGRPIVALIWPLSVFILGSDLGIIFGMLTDSPDSASGRFLISLLQGLAGGSLLYIAVCEIIPREKARKLPHWAFFIQYIALLLGFGLMSILIVYV